MYKSSEVEFTLSPNDPKEDRYVQRRMKKVEEAVEEKLATLSDEDLLLYSSQGIPANN